MGRIEEEEEEENAKSFLFNMRKLRKRRLSPLVLESKLEKIRLALYLSENTNVVYENMGNFFSIVFYRIFLLK